MSISGFGAPTGAAPFLKSLGILLFSSGNYFQSLINVHPHSLQVRLPRSAAFRRQDQGVGRTLRIGVARVNGREYTGPSVPAGPGSRI